VCADRRPAGDLRGGSGLTPRHRFAVNLRKARQAARVSQQELGARCSLHRTEISLLERGGREPRLGTLIKLAGALGVSPESLCVGMSWDAGSQRFEIEDQG
jgi:transcriptional regulator with XRE-family HTH domain